MESSLLAEQQIVNFIQDSAFHADTNKASYSKREVGGMAHQKGTRSPSFAFGPSIGVLDNSEKSLVDHVNASKHTLVGTSSRSPIAPLNKETVVSTDNLPMQTSYGQVKRAIVEHTGFSSVVSQLQKMASLSTHDNSFKGNPFSFLNNFREQILPDSSAALQDKKTQLSELTNHKGSNCCQVSRQCTATEVPLARKNPKGREGLLNNTSSPPCKLSLPPSPLNTDYEKTSPNSKDIELIQRNASEFFFSRAPGSSKADGKTGGFLEDACQMATAGEKGKKSTVANSSKPNYKVSFADTPSSDSEGQPKVVLFDTSVTNLRTSFSKSGKLMANTSPVTSAGEKVAISSVVNNVKSLYKDTSFSDDEIQPKVVSSVSHFKATEAFKSDSKAVGFLENACQVAKAGKKGKTSIVVTSSKPDCKVSADSPSSDSDTSDTHFRAREACTPNRKRGRLIENACPATTAEEKGTTSTVANTLKPLYKDTPFSDAEVQPKIVLFDTSATHFREPKAYTPDSKGGRSVGHTCPVTTARDKKTTSSVVQNSKPLYKDNAFSVVEVKPKVVSSATSVTSFTVPETLKTDRKTGRFLEAACLVVTAGEKKMKSTVVNSGKPNCKVFTDTPFPHSEVQPKVAFSAAPITHVTHFRSPESFKADIERGTLMGNTYQVSTAGEKEVTSTVANNGKPLSDAILQSKIPLSVSSTTHVSSLSQSAQMVGQDYNPPLTSGCLSAVNHSTTTRAQSVGLLHGISMLAKAAGLGSKTVSKVGCSMQSTAKHIPSLSGRKTPKQGTEQNKSDLNQHDASPLTTPFTSPYREHNSANESVDSRNITKIARPVAVHQNALTCDGKKSDRSFLKDSEFKQDERSILNIPRTSSYSVLIAPRRLPQHPRSGEDWRLVSPNKYQTIVHRHDTSREDHNFLSLARLYNDRERLEHRPRQTLIPNILVSKPRYHPYSSVRAKRQEAPMLPVWSNGYNVPKMHERRSPKPETTPIQKVPQAEGMHNKQMSLKPSSLFSPEPASSQIGFAAHGRLNSSSPNLVLPLQPDQRSSLNPRFSTTTNAFLQQDLCTVTQTLNNRIKSPSNSPETNERGFLLRSQNQDKKRTTNELCLNNGTSLSSKPSSVAEINEEDYRQMSKHSFNNVCSQTSCCRKPRLETSHSCELYLNQLRKSNEARPNSAGNSINAERASLLNSAPRSAREIVDGNNSWHKNPQVPFQGCSAKRQREGCNDRHKFNPQSLSTQDRKDVHHLLHHQKRRSLVFHHQKFTNPQQRQQEYLREERSGPAPAHCENTSQPKQNIQEINPKSHLSDTLHLSSSSSAKVNIQPRKQEKESSQLRQEEIQGGSV